MGRGRVAILVLVFALSACGGPASPPAERATAVDATAYALNLPASWTIANVSDDVDVEEIPPWVTSDAGWRAVRYEDRSLAAAGSITVTAQDVPITLDDGPIAAVEINGVTGQQGSVHLGDGAHGSTVTWSPSPGLHVAVVGETGQGPDVLVDLARTAQPLTATEWAARKKGIQYRWRDARNDPASRRVEVLAGGDAEHRWTLWATIPPDYPLGPWDARQVCIDIAVDDQLAPSSTCGMPWSFAFVDGARFVYGAADPAATAVSVRAVTVDGAPGPPFDAAAEVGSLPVEVGGGAYAARVLADHCYYQVDGAARWPSTEVIRPIVPPDAGDPCASPSSQPPATHGTIPVPTTAGESVSPR